MSEGALEPKPGGPRRPKPDLGIRTVSAVVMVGIALACLYFGGLAFTILVGLIAVGLLWEWRAISRFIAPDLFGQIVWLAIGVLYIGTAAAGLLFIRLNIGILTCLWVMATVWSVDIGAYFAGRAIGGPKLAPKISPAKTWAGLGGGIIAAMCVTWAFWHWGHESGEAAHFALGVSVLIALVAQGGDLFESWMKRRAGVKDSGRLIPGHGGLFDRMDGLLPVVILVIVMLATGASINV